MVFKFLAFAALVAVSQAGILGHGPALVDYENFQPLERQVISHQPIITKVSQVPIVAPVTKTLVQPGNAEYDFGHTLSDPYSNNHQSRMETRRGDVVTGSYSLLEADGSKRIVDYIATPLDGFKAVVRKEPAVVAPVVHEPVPVPVPVPAVPYYGNAW